MLQLIDVTALFLCGTWLWSYVDKVANMVFEQTNEASVVCSV